MADEKKTLKFQMMMSPDEAAKLDDWMFKNRLRSRAEAIRRLTRIGTEAEEALIGIMADSIALAQFYDEFLNDFGEQVLKADEADTIEAWRETALRLHGDLVLTHNKLRELVAVSMLHGNVIKALSMPLSLDDVIAEAEHRRAQGRTELATLQDEFDRQAKVVSGELKPKRKKATDKI